MRAPSAPIQTLATFGGATFLLAAILGFIPGITSRHEDLAFAGRGSRAQLLGIFQVSILLNLVHLLFGIAGLAAARAQARARGFLVKGIRPPTVPVSRLRIALSAAHTDEHVDGLLQALKELV